MTITNVGSALQLRYRTPVDPERKIIRRLIQAAVEAGVQTNPLSIVNVYVALKSKPMAILTGLAHSGKVALVQVLAQALIGDDPLRCQMMQGHAWWAGQTGNVSLFTDLQTRFNDDKFLSMIQEALQPENARRVFIACLSRISPAELIGFFSELAYQLGHGQVMRLPSVHFTEPIPYPTNLFLIGTMDTAKFDWHDADLFARTTIIPWSVIEGTPIARQDLSLLSANHEDVFLSSCIRDEWPARIKLLRILEGHTRGFEPLLQIADLLKAQPVALPDSAICEAVIYVANAWSKRGVGLFDLNLQRNLEIAIDLAIVQTILPQVDQSIRLRPALRIQLLDILNRFPRSHAILDNMI
jgi:hypothetical protein